MTVQWTLKVKFRAWGITFGKLEESGFIPVPSPPPPLPIDRVLVDKRGVYLHVVIS
jgi:hypothetical protein